MTTCKSEDWDQLLKRISSDAPEHLLEEIKKANGLRQKINICYNSIYVNQTLQNWLAACLKRPSGIKSSKEALEYRQMGNSYCEEKKYALALKCYTRSLLFSPKNSDELRCAYGNRSHIFLLVHKYEEMPDTKYSKKRPKRRLQNCNNETVNTRTKKALKIGRRSLLDSIKDIERALSNDTTELRKIKLSLRKGEALLALKKYSEARKVLEGTASMIKSLDSNLKKKALKTLQEVEKLLGIVNSETQRGDMSHQSCRIENEKLLHKEPTAGFIENPAFRSASMSIHLCQNECKGRYVVANEDVKVGDILFAERPFAFVVLPNMIDKYCSFCCKRTSALVPCLNCSLAGFCDEICREAAMKSFHSWECGGLEVCFSIGIVHLALRVALVGLTGTNIDKYTEVKNLVSHLNDVQPSDLFSYTITATLLILYLEMYSTLFSNEENRKEKLLDFGGTILLHIGQLVCNGHAIIDMQSMEDDLNEFVVTEEQVRVATAIYSSASMMNHSCEPNIINSFFDNLLIVRATKDLKKGDEVYNCYGPMVHNTEYNKRQELLLGQYFFVCDCNACKKKEGPSNKLICKHCSSILNIDSNVCESCSNEIDMRTLINDLKESDLAFKLGMTELDNGVYEISRMYLLDALRIREKYCHKNHRKLLECRDALAKAYAILGKEEDSYKLIVRNVNTIADIYGQISIELGQEIMKLISLVTKLCDKIDCSSVKQRKILEESLVFAKKGKFIFSILYGECHPRYLKLQKFIDYINFSIKYTIL